MVIVGLVGLTTLLVVYLANEPNRRVAEAEEQEEVAIERGINTYLQNCVTCHGPGGEGASADDGHIGAWLGGNTEEGQRAEAVNQSEDPTTRQERYDLIVETLHNGRGLMPAFGRGAEGGALLNDEEIHELATMIQNVDWDVVYNQAIAEAGGVYPTAGPVAPAGRRP
jgi:mono/diheme cytochrome c family protein